MSGHDDGLLRIHRHGIYLRHSSAVDHKFVGHGREPQRSGGEGVVGDIGRSARRERKAQRAGEIGRIVDQTCRNSSLGGTGTGIKHRRGTRRVKAAGIEVDVTHVYGIGEQGSESPLAEIILKILYVVGAKLVNDDSHHEPWSCGIRLCGRAERGQTYHHRGCEPLHL